MIYRYMDSEKIEKKRRNSVIRSGVYSIIISLFFIALGLVFILELKSPGGLIFMLIFAAIFIAAGIYFFNKIKIDEKRSRALDDPNSRLYKKRQRYIAKKRDGYLRKAEKHGSLKSVMCRRASLRYGLFTLLVWFLTFITLPVGIVFVFIILDIALPIAFISSFFGKQYRNLIHEYEKHGTDRTTAENDFSESRTYFISTDVISVSSRFFVATAESAVIPIENIVWIYSAYDIIHIYKHGMYSHSERKHCIIIGLSNGIRFKINCPEELCSIIVDEVTRAGISVTAGYSDKLQKLFNAAPDKFRNEIKTETNISMQPVPN